MSRKVYSFFKGVNTAFNIMGDGLEGRPPQDNIYVSWHNVGIFYQRSQRRVADRNNIPLRGERKPLECF